MALRRESFPRRKLAGAGRANRVNRELNLGPENQLAHQVSKREPPVYLPSTLTVVRRLKKIDES